MTSLPVRWTVMRSNNVACAAAAAKTQDDNNTSEDLAAIDAKKCRVGVTIMTHPTLLHRGTPRYFKILY